MKGEAVGPTETARLLEGLKLARLLRDGAKLWAHYAKEGAASPLWPLLIRSGPVEPVRFAQQDPELSTRVARLASEFARKPAGLVARELTNAQPTAPSRRLSPFAASARPDALVARLQSIDRRIESLTGAPFLPPEIFAQQFDDTELVLDLAKELSSPLTIFRNKAVLPLASALPAAHRSRTGTQWTKESPGMPRAAPAPSGRACSGSTGVPAEAAATTRYSFPSELKDREDLFYDYSVVVPLSGQANNDDINPCFLSPVAVVALASQAVQILNRLAKDKLAGVLGTALFDRLMAIATTLAAIVKYPSDADLACWRLQLRELAAAIRTVERAWLLGISVGDSPLDQLAMYRERLQTSAAKLDAFSKQNVRLPQSMAENDANVAWLANGQPNPVPQNSLLLHGQKYRPVNGLGTNPVRGDVLSYNGALPPNDDRDFWWGKATPPDSPVWVVVPYAGTGDISQGNRGWFYDSAVIGHGGPYTAVQNRLAEYLRAVGTGFSDIEGARALMRDADAWLAKLVGDGAADAQVLQLAGETVTTALQSLAILFDELSESLAAPQRPPNGVRTGLRIVYRQHWVPTGYVKGKLVGYKTLLPSESQSIRRKTFVKTTRETSTVSSFASSHQNDFSQTQRETSELLNESASKFGFQVSASGHVNFVVAGAELKTAVDGTLSSLLKGTRTSVSEMVTKGSSSFNDKREVKVRELIEKESTEEVSFEIRNPNQEITANYFYYQLFREYSTVVELHDIRPVLLVAREHPSVASVDERFISRNMHVLINVLPRQLAADAEDTCDAIEAARRRMLRARADAAYARGEYEAAREAMPVTPDDLQRQRLTDARESARVARQVFVDAEEVFHQTEARLSRVVSFVRQNLLMCMQHIWQSTSSIDREEELRRVWFRGKPLDQSTQGLRRIGFLGGEELYEYTAPDLELADQMLPFLASSSDVIANKDLKEALIDRILLERGLDLKDPNNRAQVAQELAGYIFLHDDDIYDVVSGKLSLDGLLERLRIDRVQVAQDAVVVEAMPGAIPLLEGHKLAERALDLEKACLENEHLRARIAASPWKDGSDVYRVVRVEGAAPESVTAAAAVATK